MIRSKIGRQIRMLLALEDSSERLAMAFAIGVFLTFTPFVGLHILLALGFAFLLGLNRIAVLAGVFVNNPWTLVPYYTFSTYLGRHLIGFPQGLSVPECGWSHLLEGRFWGQLGHQWRMLMPMAIGSTVLAILFAALAYPLALYAIRRGRATLRRQTPTGAAA